MIAMFGITIYFMVWLPVTFIKWASTDFLPYRVFVISEEPLNHVSLELVTLQGMISQINKVKKNTFKRAQVIYIDSIRSKRTT